MASRSRIEWTETTWNPVTGCSKVSPGCRRCYAETMSRRLRAMGSPKYRNGFAVTLHPEALEAPLKWPRPRLVFVNSMSDLFHEEVPAGFVQSAFSVMSRASWHTFQVLTKRPERAAAMNAALDWPPNVWLGASVESAAWLERADRLRATPAATKFLSLEPLLGPLPALELGGIDWVIAGGESGPGSAPPPADWVREIRDSCLLQRVPFFFKQWGGPNKRRTGRLLDGRTWDQMPPLQRPADG